MNLTLASPYLSITEMMSIDMPQFAILTGVNGAGKSHLLDAIAKRHVLVDGRNEARVVQFNFETFKLENEGSYNAYQITTERESAWQFWSQNIHANVAAYRTNLGPKYAELKETAIHSKKPLWEIDDEALLPFRQNINALMNQPHLKGNPVMTGLYALIQTSRGSADELTKDQFIARYKPYEQTRDFLPQAVGKIIWDYYVRYRNNQINDFQNERNGFHYPVLSEEGFVAEHGRKPWDVLNEILRQFDSLEYVIPSPEGLDVFGSYSMKLVHKTKKGLEIEFSSLSSGERVLMALVASVYKASADNNFPDILLLDELDASLHPSMMKNMLAVIESIFISRGIQVVLVTHSPTTVALAPEDAIFVMQKEGPQRVRKASKKEALSILTEGFATLEEGLTIFDEVAREAISVITEGHNVRLVQRLLQNAGVMGVCVIEGLEGMTGKNHMKTLFEFFSRMPHKNKVLFVWDCDVSDSFEDANNTFAYIIPRNNANTIAKKGIENAFPAELFSGFTTTVIDSQKNVRRQFDESQKKNFVEFVLKRNNAADFAHLAPLTQKIQSMSQT